VEEITADQYPESCTFTKSAKGENQKYVDSFSKDYSIGDNVEVEYKLKSIVYPDKKTGEEKMFNDITAFKTVNVKHQQSSEPANQPKGEEKKKEGISKEEYNKTVESLSKSSQASMELIEDDLPF
jgi:hypothetical protein